MWLQILTFFIQIKIQIQQSFLVFVQTFFLFKKHRLNPALPICLMVTQPNIGVEIFQQAGEILLAVVFARLKGKEADSHLQE